jgi:hypothetical protein
LGRAIRPGVVGGDGDYFALARAQGNPRRAKIRPSIANLLNFQHFYDQKLIFSPPGQRHRDANFFLKKIGGLIFLA